MKQIWASLIIAIAAVTATAGDFDAVHEGDLAFVITPQGNAITSVTQAVESLPIDHVAIMHRIGGDDGPLYALEAIPRGGVCLTPVDSFLCANGVDNIIIGRVAELDAKRSVRKALSFVGLPYDFYFMPDDSAIYCSELVQKCYCDAAGNPIFNTIPMTFRDKTGEIHPHWVQHYAAKGLEVPEGAPGSNPGDLSRNSRVAILKRY